MNTRITKAARAERLARAQALLEASGWTVRRPLPTAAAEHAVTALVAEFNCQRRTALRIVAQAERRLRGEVVDTWARGAGRPRKWVRVQVEDAVKAGLAQPPARG
jgi:hypothetical protein